MKYLKFKKFVKTFRKLKGMERMDYYYSLPTEIKDLILDLAFKSREKEGCYVSYELHSEEERN